MLNSFLSPEHGWCRVTLVPVGPVFAGEGSRGHHCHTRIREQSWDSIHGKLSKGKFVFKTYEGLSDTTSIIILT